MWGFSDWHWRPVGAVVLNENPGEGIKPEEMEFVARRSSIAVATVAPLPKVTGSVFNSIASIGCGRA
jgi:hypothetical protein